MTGPQRGFLLLTSHLGNPERRPLSTARLRMLADRMRMMEQPESDREITARDLVKLGYSASRAEHIVKLLSEEELLEHYLCRGENQGCFPITRISEDYPLILRKRLGLDSPGVLWGRGDKTLLAQPTVSLVGSRELGEENGLFAAEVGRQAALQGYVLVSGNARGADRTAQESCLNAGGSVISVVADELWKHPPRERVLYLSEDGWGEEFSASRALSRNRVIHALGLKTFVAQSALGTGGTWDGTAKNLRFGWSPVFCFRDGSNAASELSAMGAGLIGCGDLGCIYDLPDPQKSFFDTNTENGCGNGV